MLIEIILLALPLGLLWGWCYGRWAMISDMITKVGQINKESFAILTSMHKDGLKTHISQMIEESMRLQKFINELRAELGPMVDIQERLTAIENNYELVIPKLNFLIDGLPGIKDDYLTHIAKNK